MDDAALREYARLKLLDIIVAQVKELRDLRATMSDGVTDRDRAEAGVRALFDPSKNATLARKYEAAAAREMSRAMKEFRLAEAEARAIRQGDEPTRSTPGRGSLASFFQVDETEDRTGSVAFPPAGPASEGPSVVPKATAPTRREPTRPGGKRRR